MAKKDRNAERNARRERIEQLRKESQRAERRRTLIVVAFCVVIALVIVSLTGWSLWREREEDQELAGIDLDAIGVSADAAACAGVETAPGEGQGEHVPTEPVEYTDTPPAFGPHRPTPAQFGRKFYTSDDRPEVEELVHNLEHGYTILWYDETVADDAEQLGAVEDIAAKFDGSADPGTAEYEEGKFIAAPWTGDDGGEFPDGTHVALTHWAAEGDDALPEEGMGVWNYCEAPSGEVVADFMSEYPAENAMEVGGI